MPISCQFELPRLTNDEMGQIDYEVMTHAFATHKARGRLCDETVYQIDLAQRLEDAGIAAEIEVPIVLSFGGFETTVKMDLLIAGQAVYELKTVEKLNAKHDAQLLGYLYMTNATRGKLINFRPKSVETRFINTSRTKERTAAIPVRFVGLLWGSCVKASCQRNSCRLGNGSERSRLSQSDHAVCWQ